MRKCFLLLLTFVTTGLFAQQKINNPQCARNAQGLITLEDCPTEHSQLSVKISNEGKHLTIYCDGKVMQELDSEEEFVAPPDDDSVHFMDANFDGHCDIFVGPGASRTYSSLLIWNPGKGQFELVVGTDINPHFQNFMIDPVSKILYDGGSSSACECDGYIMKWNGNRLQTLQELKVIFEPTQYRANGVKYKYTVRTVKTEKLIKATNYVRNLPLTWQKYAKSMDW